GIGSGTILVEQAYKGQSLSRERVTFVDSDFLKIFELPVLSGTPDLTAPNTFVLTKSAALQYFQTVDVANESLTLINQFGEYSFRITGVIEDFPSNSDIQASILASMSTLESEAYIGYNTWLDLNTLSSSFVTSYFTLADAGVADNVVSYRKSLATAVNAEEPLEVALQAVSNMHLDRGESGLLPTFGNARLVWFLLILAILILIIAWINYVNLSTAQSLKKAHAVSVKKVIGANRAYLIRQQLSETFLLTLASVALAIIGCLLLQPFFNYFVDFPLSLGMLLNAQFVLSILAFLLLTSLTAGCYVAFVLTSFNPSLILKGSFLRSKKGIWVRKTLVTAQFGITIAFIAATAIMLMQIKYLQNKDVGIAMEQRLSFTGPASYGEGWVDTRDAFLEQIKQLPFVKKFSANGGNPGQGYNMSLRFNKEQSEAVISGGILGADEGLCSIFFIDESFLDVFEIEILAGTAPTASMVRRGWWNHNKMVFNETAIKQLGFENPTEAVNKVVYANVNGQIQEIEILAVVKDYNHNSLHAEMDALALAPSLNHAWFTLALTPNTTSEQLAEIEQIYTTHFPKSPFNYQFVDEYYRSFYEEDRRLGQLVSVGAGLAIFISCLGLLGLVAYTVEQRNKEISIRKVLGASVSSIVGLISKDFVPLIVVAIFVASPLAYYAMTQWLADFAYRIEIRWWVFALAGVVAIGIALLTVSVQSIKAALADPVKSLRNE
ncbi:MAG: FtsX-like permease family protein, partial [Bacteroidota bacterium]